MFRNLTIALVISLLSVTSALAQPAAVPRQVNRALDKASYVELARQWKDYIVQEGESTDALVNLGRAYDYSGEPDAALIAARRAVELGPDDPKALAFLGKVLAVYGDDDDGTLKVLRHCREVAPDYEPGLTMLAAAYLRLGCLPQANEVMKTIFDQGIVSLPLRDYAYNMLVGLPEGAVLITNGDNDTFPPLSLQAGMNFRTDVVLINRSLLNLPKYAEAVFAQNPQVKPDFDIKAHKVKMVDGQPTILSNALLKTMIAEQKVPVYITASANTSSYGFKPEGHLEGLNIRTGGQGMSAEESAQLILEKYRLDSATDWGYAWSLEPMLAKLIRNYPAAMAKLASQKDLPHETKVRLLNMAADIAEFHHMDDISPAINKLQSP